MKEANGQVEAFDKKDIERVMPYTFELQFVTSSQNYHFLGKKGCVKVGDFIVNTDSLLKAGQFNVARVIAIDTRSETATKYFKGVRMLTESIDTSN
jgi:hypothetical protein